MNIDEIKQFVKGGEWTSLAVELRPSEDRTGSGKIDSFYVTRNFQYLDNDEFIGSIMVYGDPYGKIKLAKFTFKGHTLYGSEHPIADGAYEIDYVLDEAFEVTPLHQMFADNLNQVPIEGLEPFKANIMQDIKGKAFPLFNIQEGQTVVDHDLMYIHNDMLFMGAKHVDGRGFDKPENRPTNLQVPLERK